MDDLIVSLRLYFEHFRPVIIAYCEYTTKYFVYKLGISRTIRISSLTINEHLVKSWLANFGLPELEGIRTTTVPPFAGPQVERVAFYMAFHVLMV